MQTPNTVTQLNTSAPLSNTSTAINTVKLEPASAQTLPKPQPDNVRTLQTRRVDEPRVRTVRRFH